MPELLFTQDIHAPVQAVFDLIADLPNYSKWLPPSSLYQSVTEYSELPIRQGTRYTDQGTGSKLTGTVTEFEAPNRITFHQASTSWFGKLDITIRYTLEAAGEVTHLTRRVTIVDSGLYRLAEPILVRSISTEVKRIMEMMKMYLEKNSGK